MAKKENEKLQKYIDASLLCQVITTMSVLMFFIMYIISGISSMLKITEAILTLLMLIMAVNNHFIFKRKYFTFLYIVVAICSCIFIFVNI